MTQTYDPNLIDDFLSFLTSARPRGIRSYLQWATEELRIPDGPYKGLRFDPDIQPFAGIWLRLLTEGTYKRRVFLGPQQCGKSFVAFGIPILYAVFELRETTLCGLPDANMVQDKWRADLLPMIVASSYADLLPVKGSGARGGDVRDAVHFTNGVVLRFMTGGGGDKSRAAFTSRILGVTEVDGFDKPGATSKEADKFAQLEGRTRAFGEAVGIIPEITLECTVTDVKGRTWTEYTAGTESRLAMPCQHCEQFVTLERKDLVGWQDARSAVQARELAHFVCNACGLPWTDEGRKLAARSSILLHAGQSLDARGRIIGEPKETETLGFRVSAVDNMFKTMGDLGVEEWTGQRNPDEDSAERALRQWVWAIPTEPTKSDEVPLTKEAIMHRQGREERGKCPSDTIALGIGIDLGRHWAHYCATALNDSDTGNLVDYNQFEVKGAAIGDERAVRVAIDEAVDMFAQGYPNADGKMIPLGALLIDCGWMTDQVREACHKWRLKGIPIYAAMGFSDRAGGRQYRPPKVKKPNRRYPIIGRNLHEEINGRNQPPTLHINVDAWKTTAAQTLSIEPGLEGSVVLFPVATARQHARFANHVLAEKKVEEFRPGKQGSTVYWEKLRDQNHYLDGFMLSLAACHVTTLPKR